MDRYGRQRLLKRRSGGQALIEILPATLIFVMVISVTLRYFEIFRDAVEKEQVARNLLFAKIGNSGTLTTPPSQLANPRQINPQDTATSPIQFDIEGGRVAVDSTNAFVGSDATCFSAFPPDWRKENPIFFPGIGSGAFPSVFVLTYAVIYRNASQGSCPFN